MPLPKLPTDTIKRETETEDSMDTQAEATIRNSDGEQLDDELQERLRSLRVFDCELPAFDIGGAPEHPIELFRSWLIEAITAGVREPHAMTLSTVDADRRPSSRVLILKGLSSGALQFASSRTSRKGRELSATLQAAAGFYWRELGRQVRLTGQVLDRGRDAAA